MIAKLKGLIDSYGEDWVIIDVGGVGYLVSCSTRTLSSLPSVGEAATVAIETYVREDQIRLFGFASDLEREWFRLLLTVQGVGTKVALAILSTLPPSELASAISMQDKAMVARSPGVGPKVAQRIIGELKDKSPAISGISEGLAAAVSTVSEATGGSASDAISALTNLGYARAQAGMAVSKVIAAEGEDVPTETLIRKALKELAG